MSINITELKAAAAGHWHSILSAICGFTEAQLNPKIKQPCPLCGGRDRFRAFDDIRETGGVYCNQCLTKNNNDGLAVIQWARGCSFSEACKLVSDFLNLCSGSRSRQPSALGVSVQWCQPAPVECRSGKQSKKSYDSEREVKVAIAQSLAASKTIDSVRHPDLEWKYVDKDGKEVGAVYRWDGRNGDKVIRPASVVRSANGECSWSNTAIPEPRPLYQLPEVMRNDSVFVCEGEKAAEALRQIGLCATTSAGGCRAASKTDWSPLDSKRVVLVPDNDTPGEDYARDVVRILKDQAPDAVVQVIRLRDDLADIPEGGDAADWLQNYSSVDIETLRSRLDKLPDCVSDFEGNQEDAKKAIGLELDFRDAWAGAFKPRPMREVIIEGLLRRGEVGNVIAATKTGKSWFALALLISVAIGKDWLGRRVAKGAVLLVDNELHEETIECRIHTVCSALSVSDSTPRADFEYLACRGNGLSLMEMIEEIPKRYKRGSLNLIVIDAKYRLFGNGLEENSNDDQTTFHNLLDKFAHTMNCAIVLVHHTTKGDQSGKAVTDIGSGGGSQARAADLHLIIRPHKEEGLAVMEAAVRSFPMVDPRTLRWEYPLWTVVPDVDPIVKSERSSSASKQESKDADGIDALRQIMRENSVPMSVRALRSASRFGNDRVERLLDIGSKLGLFKSTTPVDQHKNSAKVLYSLANESDSFVQRSDSVD